MTTNKNPDKELPTTFATKSPISFEESFRQWWINFNEKDMEENCDYANAGWTAREPEIAQMREELARSQEALQAACDVLTEGPYERRSVYNGAQQRVDDAVDLVLKALGLRKEDRVKTKDGIVEDLQLYKSLKSLLAQERAARTEAEAKCAEMMEALSSARSFICGVNEDCDEDEERDFELAKSKKALSTSCGKGYASPELVKEAIEALKHIHESLEHCGHIYGDSTASYEATNSLELTDKFTALACLNQKEKAE